MTVTLDAPIFIVGPPRSGTTLLRNILNRHPKIGICDETHFRHYVYGRRRAFGDLTNLKNRRRLIHEYLSLKRLRLMDSPRLAEKLMREGTSYQALFTSFLKHFAEVENKQRWGEKTPRHAVFAETLCQWYPGATLIHMIRDPRDVVASLQRMSWAADSVVQNARVWLRYNLAAQRCSHLPQYLPVRYENLVAQPERELMRICQRLGEEYTPSLLDSEQIDPQRRALQPAAASFSARAKEAITMERLGKWREELKQDEVSQIEWTIGDHMETLGYHRSLDPPSSLTVARGVAAAVSDTVHMRFQQLPGIWYHVFRPTQLAKEESWIRRRVRKGRQPSVSAG